MTEPQRAERYFVVAPIERVDVRDSSSNDDNTWTMSGYAAVFDHQAIVLDNKFVRATVGIDSHAFDRVFKEQPFTEPGGAVHFNRGHDMNTAVAATDVPAGKPGSLQLTVERQGLRFLAKVARDDPDGIALASKMRSGVVRQASFAFVASENTYTFAENDDGRDEEHRQIMEVQHIYDVCACPQGLFPQTISQLQQYARLLGQPTEVGGHPRQPDLGGATTVNPETGGSADITPPTGWSASLIARADRIKPISGLTEGIRDVRSGQHPGDSHL